MGEERRSTPRYHLYSPVRLQRPGTPQVIETLTKDLGVGGLRCISPSVFPVSTELNVEMMLSNGEGPIQARGRTAWFRMVPHSEQFDVGISFIDMPPQDKRRLSGYIERLSLHTTHA